MKRDFANIAITGAFVTVIAAIALLVGQCVIMH